MPAAHVSETSGGRGKEEEPFEKGFFPLPPDPHPPFPKLFIRSVFRRLPPLPLFLILLGAAGFFLGMPNTVMHFPPLALLYPLCLYLLAGLAASGKQAFFHGWLLSLAANAAGLYWMVYPMHDVAGIPLALAVPCVLPLFGYFACYGALSCLAMFNLRLLFAAPAPGSIRGMPSLLLPPLLGGLAFAGFEVLCGLLFTGFPWLSLSTAFGFSESWIQAASLVGAYGLSGLLASAACLAAADVLAFPDGRRAALALGAILFLSLPGYGLLRLGESGPEPSGPPLPLLMVQGNIDQNQKWLPSFQKGTLEHYITLSERALRELRNAEPWRKTGLVLWPETAMPFYFELHPDYAETLYRFASDNRVALAFGSLGVLRRDARPARLNNRLYLLSPSGKTSGYYDKRHLVPFGEYTPFSADIPFLRELLQGMDFSPGSVTDPLPLSTDDGAYSLGVLICYEAIFPALAQERVEHGADILVNVSNDGWFRQSSAPWQHLSHVALRTVEQARPALRATNTGVTAVLDARGRIQSRIADLFTADTLAATVEPSTEITVFHRIHPIPETALAALALFSLFGYKLRKSHKR